jgi:hypothetical protein
MLGKHYRPHEGIDLRNRIGDHASVFGAERNRTVMAKADSVPGITGLEALIAVHDVTPFDRLAPSYTLTT